jgi:phospholipid-binding lipoprotein MlaA
MKMHDPISGRGEFTKMVCWICFLSAACLAILPSPCTGSSSPEFSISILPMDDALQGEVTMETPEPLSTEEPWTSFHPTEGPLSIEKEEGPIQVALANIPPPLPSDSEEPLETIADPLEPVNRAFFHFNDKFYSWVLKPVATGYKAVVPEGLRVGVRNFFSNVVTPIRLVNCLLQANLEHAGTETARFFLNTTFGLAGFLDPAKTEFSIEKREKDFGQTLGIWGIGPAFYINWPILGPSSLRDTAGYVGDVLADPTNYLITSILINLAVKSYAQVNETSLRIGEYEDFKGAALDPYIALKDAYHQYRQNKIREK